MRRLTELRTFFFFRRYEFFNSVFRKLEEKFCDQFWCQLSQETSYIYFFIYFNFIGLL